MDGLGGPYIWVHKLLKSSLSDRSAAVTLRKLRPRKSLLQLPGKPISPASPKPKFADFLYGPVSMLETARRQPIGYLLVFTNNLSKTFTLHLNILSSL